jgi:hypothetical protein
VTHAHLAANNEQRSKEGRSFLSALAYRKKETTTLAG